MNTHMYIYGCLFFLTYDLRTCSSISSHARHLILHNHNTYYTFSTSSNLDHKSPKDKMQYFTSVIALFLGVAAASPIIESRQTYVPCSGL